MFVREYGFTITEHDPERPWMVLSSEHGTIKLTTARASSRRLVSSGRRRAGASSSTRGSSRQGSQPHDDR